MKPTLRDALWLAALALCCAVVAWLSDEVTQHAPARPSPLDDLDVSPAAKQVWTELAMRADGDRAWALLVRGSLFTGRAFGGEA